MAIHNIGKTEKAEMYLKAIMMIGQESPPVTVTKVADFMSVSPASASEMIKRLEHNGLAEASQDGIQLTAEGTDKARRLVRRMRLAERLLSDVLGLPLQDLYDEACKLEHAISAAVEERIAERLGHPETCPHGYPIPSHAGRVDCPLAATLSSLKAGETAQVVSLPERDRELLAYLTELGIVPGTQITVDEIAPFNGPMFLRINGKRQAVSREALEGVRVSVAG